jgi:DNA gyrase subunit B
MYVDTEDKMDEWLLSEGLETAEIFSLAKAKPTKLDNAKLKGAFRAVTELEHLRKRLHKKGVSWEEALDFKDKEKFPLARVEEDDGTFKLLHTDKEVTAWTDAFLKRHQEQDLQAYRKELPELKKIGALTDKLADAGFDVTADAAVAKGEPKPLYQVKIDEEEKNAFSVAELLEAIKDAGRKGATIQRYKGLGEMNPEQFWETTMDPVHRKLLRVAFDPTSAEADDVFSTLMGDAVEPRRQFIEANASEVQNLDV